MKYNIALESDPCSTAPFVHSLRSLSHKMHTESGAPQGGRYADNPTKQQLYVVLGYYWFNFTSANSHCH